jgi:hypothetical protein
MPAPAAKIKLTFATLFTLFSRQRIGFGDRSFGVPIRQDTLPRARKEELTASSSD